jgi:hypothetical protein
LLDTDVVVVVAVKVRTSVDPAFTSCCERATPRFPIAAALRPRDKWFKEEGRNPPSRQWGLVGLLAEAGAKVVKYSIFASIAINAPFLGGC